MLGEAVDISPASNHGKSENVEYFSDGRYPGSGLLKFSKSESRVRIPQKTVWNHLYALKIETWVKLTLDGKRRNIVEGDNSFAFFIHPDRTLWGTFLAPSKASASPIWHGANSKDNSPDVQKRTVPIGEWVKLTYVHDGFSSLRLYINDVLVAGNYDLISSVQPVQSRGIHIGNWPAGNLYPFVGEIDEIKIWKYDPDFSLKQFVNRPMSNCASNCWTNIFNYISTKTIDPNKREQLMMMVRCIYDAQIMMIRAIRGSGEESINQCQAFASKYRELWSEGEINTYEMRDLLDEWINWIKKTVGYSLYSLYMDKIKESYQILDSFTEVSELDINCDKEFKEYINIFSSLI